MSQKPQSFDTSSQQTPEHFDYDEVFRRAGLLVGRLETGWNGNFHAITVDGPFSEQDFQAIPRPMVLDLGKVDFAHYPITPAILKQVSLSPKLWSLTIRKLNGNLPSDWLSWIQSDNFRELILVGVSVDLDLSKARLGELAILSLSKTPFDLSLARQLIALPKIATVRLDGDQIVEDAFLLLGNSKTLDYIVIRGNYSQESIELLERKNPRLKIVRTSFEVEPPPFRINSIRSANRTIFSIRADGPSTSADFLDIPENVRANAVVLDFGFHRFNRKMLNAIKTCPRLGTLIISNPDDIPHDWPQVLPSASLRSLDCFKCAFELSPDGPLKNLETLRIQGSPLSADRASQIAALTKLKHLDIFGCRVDKEVLERLSESKSLIALKLTKTNDNAQTVDEFQANNPKIQISTDVRLDVKDIEIEEYDPPVDDEAVEFTQIKPFTCRRVVHKAEHTIVQAHDRFIRGLAFSHDGRFLAVWGDEQLRIWDVANAQFILEYEASVFILSVVFAADRKKLLVLTQNGNVFEINTESWDLKRVLIASHNPQVVLMSHDGYRIVTGPREIELFESEGFVKSGEFEAHDAGGRSMLLSGDGRRLITANADKTVKVWDLGQQELLDHWAFDNWTSVAEPKDQSIIAVASTVKQNNRQQATLFLYDPTKMVQRKKLTGAVLEGTLQCDSQICFSNNGQILAWMFRGEHDTGEVINNEIQTRDASSLTLWSMSSFKQVASYRLNPSCVAISPNSKEIAIGTHGGKLEIWDLDAFLTKFRVND